jgi:hypothetical protein
LGLGFHLKLTILLSSEDPTAARMASTLNRASSTARERRMKVKKLLLIGIIAIVPAVAHAREMFDCDDPQVRETLLRVTHAQTIVETNNIPSDDLNNFRFCKSEVLEANGRLAELIYEVRWTSASEGRFYLQIKGGRFL